MYRVHNECGAFQTLWSFVKNHMYRTNEWPQDVCEYSFKNTRSADLCSTSWRTLLSSLLKKVLSIGWITYSFSAVWNPKIPSLEHILTSLFVTLGRLLTYKPLSSRFSFSSALNFFFINYSVLSILPERFVSTNYKISGLPTYPNSMFMEVVAVAQFDESVLILTTHHIWITSWQKYEMKNSRICLTLLCINRNIVSYKLWRHTDHSAFDTLLLPNTFWLCFMLSRPLACIALYDCRAVFGRVLVPVHIERWVTWVYTTRIHTNIHNYRNNMCTLGRWEEVCAGEQPKFSTEATCPLLTYWISFAKKCTRPDFTVKTGGVWHSTCSMSNEKWQYSKASAAERTAQ